MVQRIQKVLASAGIGSRRACEALVADGRVTVNGAVVSEPGAKADPDADDIRVDGRRIRDDVRRVYVVLNKPTGFVTTVRDPHAEHTVMELVRGLGERVYPVGRLDAETAGLLILTNDGDFAQALAHPSHRVAKVYRAVVRGIVDDHAVTDLRHGVMLEDGLATATAASIVERRHPENVTILDITLQEGRKRQVRRMLQTVGYRVLALTRTQVGPVSLEGLAPGTWRKLRASELAALCETPPDAQEAAPPAKPPAPPRPSRSAPPRRSRRTKKARAD
jgi:23S rRNA pseudouridine2605 synthase